MKRHYFKTQTAWTRIPAAIEAHRCESLVGLAVHSERSVTAKPVEPSRVFLTAHEAQALAAWLSEQADHLLAKERRAVARRAARLAAKRGEEL